ncbi:aromatic amino acid ammonia-lyase [Brevibacterium oceani]|uniref:aromatic amino acid ammonia-lyase n=1 Tax=Brevibacterium oceani TaxID=358099 RepID=UPI001B33FF8C|nr:aromatic amino acid ammonia-lyase [Brevibacterium oceani]
MSSHEHLTLTTLIRFAEEGGTLPFTDTTAMTAAHDFAVEAVDTVPIYGRSTGVGANKSVDLAESNSIDQDLRLLRSHAVGAGDLVDDETVRMAMAIRVNQLLQGGSGISADVVDALRTHLDEGHRPVIHEVGSLGTGDLSQMAELALTLTGEKPTADGTARALWTPHGGDALPFISSNAFTLATAARAVAEVDRFIDHCVRIAAASMKVAGANLEPFAAAVQTARPEPGQKEAATRILDAIGPSSWEARRLQDTFGFRAITPVLSTLLTARSRLAEAVETEMNASPENPLVDVDSAWIYHNGNFHTQQLMIELEATTLALFGVAQLSYDRTTRLSEPDITGLEPFLSDSTPGSSGIMMAEYVTASALNELRIQAQPASLSNVVVSRGSEDHAPFTAQAARQLLTGLEQARRVLAVELLGASRGVAMAEAERTEISGTNAGPTASAPFLDYLALAPIDPTITDRSLSDDIAALERFVATDLKTLRSKDMAS